jgi:hypothetical protein
MKLPAAFQSVVALTLGVLAVTATAQTAISYRALCQNVGVNPFEAIGDREGHSLAVLQQTCRIEGAPLDGGILTGNIIYEWDKVAGTGLAGQSVVRKPGASVVIVLGEFKNALTMTDGKVTGFIGTGQGIHKLATGSAASLAGKSFSYTARSTGPGQYVIEFKVE